VPVTRKFLSVVGAVRQPKSFWIPVGTSFRELIRLAGGAKVSDFGIFVSGIMMGTLTFDLDDVVTKTTAGLIILPRQHVLVTRRSQPAPSMNRIGKSACDQCSYCTELCPRYLLGYQVMPHRVMRSLGFTLSGEDYWNQWSQLCCACGLCTLYACPEDLFPKEACDQGKAYLRTAGIKCASPAPVRVHPLQEARRVPLAQLRRRLVVEDYETDAPFDKIEFVPPSVRIKLSQHVGKPAQPTVGRGDKVEQGQLIARLEPSALGANLHASMAGKITAVTESYIEIQAQ